MLPSFDLAGFLQGRSWLMNSDHAPTTGFLCSCVGFLKNSSLQALSALDAASPWDAGGKENQGFLQTRVCSQT